MLLKTLLDSDSSESSGDWQKQPPEVFYKKVVLRNIHWKTAGLESVFNKVRDLQACAFIKMRIQHRCFPVNIAKISGTPILKKICERFFLLLYSIQIYGLGKVLSF